MNIFKQITLMKFKTYLGLLFIFMIICSCITINPTPPQNLENKSPQPSVNVDNEGIGGNSRALNCPNSYNLSKYQTCVLDYEGAYICEECVHGARNYFKAHPEIYGAGETSFLPIGSKKNGDCEALGACHYWIDAIPDSKIMEKIENDGKKSLQKYDVIIYKPTDGNNYYGHINIVKSVDSNGKVTVVESNWESVPTGKKDKNGDEIYVGCGKDTRILNASDMRIIYGWYRPRNVTSPPSPSITITYPTGGENLLKNNNYVFHWKTQDIIGNVKIKICKGNNECVTLGADEPDDGSFDFKPTPDFDNRNDYRIQIFSVMNNSIITDSNYFSIGENLVQIPPVEVKVLSVQIITRDISIRVDGRQTLSALVNYSNNHSDNLVNWASSDNNVGTVDLNGNFKALKEGVVTITATSQKDGNQKDSISFQVQAKLKEDVKVNSISISHQNVKLKIGEEQVLVANVKYSDNSTDNLVTWGSSDNNTVMIDLSGKIKGLREGAVTITATSKDINIKATTIVTVEAVKVVSITPSTTNLPLKVGESQNLSAIVTYSDNKTDNNITWSSSDSTIASVDNNGKVTALKNGNTIITVSSIKDSLMKANVNIAVSEIPVIVNSVITNPNSLTLEELKTYNLSATVTYSNTLTDSDVIWNSSDSQTASVDNNGKVTAYKVGTVTITATSNRDNSKKGTTSVTVTPKPVIVTSVSVNPSSLTLKVGESKSLSATVIYSNGTTDTRLTWDNLNPSVASLNSGNVSGLNTGNTTIKATSTIDIGKSASVNITVQQNTIAETCNGIDDDNDGIIDNPSSCWTTIYRFKDPNTGARAWNNTTTPPNGYSNYVYEIEAWVSAKNQIPNTFELVQVSKQTDHVLVQKNSSDYNSLISAGYQQTANLGYVWTVNNAASSKYLSSSYNVGKVYRFRYSTSGGGAHLFTRGAENLTGMTCEPPVRFEVITNQQIDTYCN